MGVPGWPELAAWTASIDSVRMVLIASWSSSASVMVDFLPRVSITGRLHTATGVRASSAIGRRPSSNRAGIEEPSDLHSSLSALHYRRVVPAARRRDILVHFVRPPAS